MVQRLHHNPIAIIGLASVFPMARNVHEYWDNIVRRVDAITDVPTSRWNSDDYYDPDPTAPDKTYCKRGGFLPDIDFDPLEFGLPPNILEVTDVSQMISLVVARDAMIDAGYGSAADDLRARTGVVLGVGGGQKLITPLTSRLQYPVWERALKSSGLSDEDTAKVIEKIKLAYIKWEENSFPGMLGNVIAGRVANRLDLGGMNCVVDAACASSMGAMKLAISDLVEGRSDMMITGGVDTDNSIFMYMCFSKTPAFSQGSNPRPFDAESDGMMVGEGVGMMVLKRLEDAERDGDRIYAVIKGIGTSSDGRYKSIYAPRGEGQERALDRAYEDAGYSPSTVELIEAHGTGTVAGDFTETTTIVRFFNKHSDDRNKTVALGSVKSQIGHTKAAAGVAGMIKAALALHHKVLPATINVTNPNPKLGLEDSALYVNSETRPWITDGSPRRAGVSSFGFGGTNFHFALEEHVSDHQSAYRMHHNAEMILLAGATPESIITRAQDIIAGLQGEDANGHFLNTVKESRALEIPAAHARLGFVAGTPEEMQELLQAAVKVLQSKMDAEEFSHPKGIFYRRQALDLQGRVVALFSGQGSQYTEMGRELALNFPQMRESYQQLDALFERSGLKPVSDVVFPPHAYTKAEQEAQAEQLQRTDYVQPAVGGFSAGVYRILQAGGFKPDFVAGHSFGELTALWAGGAMSDEDYYTLVKARGLAMAPPADPAFDAGTMMAITGDVSNLANEIAGMDRVYMANINSPKQVVIAGARDALEQARQTLTSHGYNVVSLPVSAAFHTPLVSHAQKPFAQAISRVAFRKPQIPVYSNASAQPYPDDPAAMRQILTDHILQSVSFRQEIENIHAAGGYLFIEFGPRNVLTNLVKEILGDKPHMAVALNGSRQKDSDRQLREAVVQLRVTGLNLSDIDPYRVIPESANGNARRKGMRIQINGGAYVTDATRKAWQDALNDGHRIAGGGVQEVVREVVKEVIKEVPVEVRVEVPVMTASTAQGNTQVNLQDGLERFSQHQAEILKAHEQYLANQADYIKVFSQLAAQHQAVINNAALPADSVASLSRGLDAFHEHQAETLRVHEDYLRRQSEYSQTLLQVLRQQMNGNNGSNGNGTTLKAAPVLDAPKHVPGPTPVAAPRAAPAPAPAAPAPAPVAAPVATPAPAAPGIDLSALSSAMLDIVSEKTGYPTEMLELEMDIEADLGIDSIKRVEILGAMRERFPQLPQLKPEELAELRTLGEIVAYMAANAPGGVSNSVPAPAPVAAPPAAPAPAPVAAPVATPTPAAPGIDLSALSSAMLEIVSEKTGYPTEMLELEMDIEADLGIDSIKRVEILGAMRERFPQLPQLKPEELAELRTLGEIVAYMAANAPGGVSNGVAVPQPAAAPAPAAPAPAPVAAPVATPAPAAPGIDLSALSSAMLDIVSEKTGYPTEMLELEMDIEADLGIDSIKRVEILGAMRERFPQLPQLKPEELAELRTLGEIVAYMAANAPVGVSNGVAVPQPAAAPAPAAPAPAPAGTTLPMIVNGIARRAALVKYLPEPDAMAVNLPAGSICLLTDDGTPLTAEVAGQLVSREWKVIVLAFPAEIVGANAALPAGVTRVTLADTTETHLQSTLESIGQTHGPVAAFIHLNAPAKVLAGSPPNGNFFIEQEKVILKHVFLLAKHLKKTLNEAAQAGFACFVTVARLDGTFGTTRNGDSGAIAGGLFGLTKSVNLEWPEVYCRALDLAATLPDAETAAQLIKELQDPNHLVVEVAYGPQGRVTFIAADPANAQANA